VAIRIKLRNGKEAIVRATLAQWQEALQSASQRGQLLEIRQPDGSMAVINPSEIDSFREDPAAATGLAEQFKATAGA
jgi:hypothetical protein